MRYTDIEGSESLLELDVHAYIMQAMDLREAALESVMCIVPACDVWCPSPRIIYREGKALIIAELAFNL